MPCKPLDFGGGVTGFSCQRGGRAAPCSVVGCTRPSVALCDFPLGGRKAGQTCHRALCESHRKTQLPRPGVKSVLPGDSIDYCPPHDAFARAGAATQKGAEAGVDGGCCSPAGVDRGEGDGAAIPTAEGPARGGLQSKAIGDGQVRDSSASAPNRRIRRVVSQ